MSCKRYRTCLVKDDMSVVATTREKYPLPTSPSRGNIYTTPVASTAIPNLAQKAITHGRSISPVPVNGCFPRAGLDHFATSHPTSIWAGKSSNTATARSSFERPFSRSFKPVTESLTRNPILHVSKIRRKDWISNVNSGDCCELATHSSAVQCST